MESTVAAQFDSVSTTYAVDWLNNRLLASAHGGGEIHLWDVPGNRQVRTFVGHQGGTAGLDFSADLKPMVSAGNDGMVKLWQVATGQLVGTLYLATISENPGDPFHPRPTTNSVSLADDDRELAVSLWSHEYTGAGHVIRWRW